MLIVQEKAPAGAFLFLKYLAKQRSDSVVCYKKKITHHLDGSLSVFII